MRMEFYRLNRHRPLPYLLELAGEPAGANEGKPFLLPVTKIQQIQQALADTYPIRALDASLVASENVLAPRSQETIECFQEALQYVRQSNPATVADIGCGSGCLTLLAQQELGEGVELYASDLLPEAVATTKLNLQRLLPDSDAVRVMPVGDLFGPFPSHQFDVIIFNAPWVVARVRNRAELAIHDEKQETLKRFFAQVSNFLKPDGTILLGYADASGVQRQLRIWRQSLQKPILESIRSLKGGLRRIGQSGSGSRFGCMPCIEYR